MATIGKTLYVTNRRAWRAWLRRNHKTAPDIWLIYYKKDSGKPRISYNDAVEEALCYGWIDSIEKGIDTERFAQRFSPRRSTSVLSPANRERIRKLIAEKKMTAAGLAAVVHVFDPAKDIETGPVEVPPYIRRALEHSPPAWEHFQNFSESYKRIRIAYIEHQKIHGKDQQARALRNFVAKSAKNKRLGLKREA